MRDPSGCLAFGTESLGTIISEIYVARDAHWLPGTQGASDKRGQQETPTATSLKSPVKKTSQAEPQLKLGETINGKATALTLKDGIKLRAQFQHGAAKPRTASKVPIVVQLSSKEGEFVELTTMAPPNVHRLKRLDRAPIGRRGHLNGRHISAANTAPHG